MAVRVACAQVEPVVFDRAATIAKLDSVAREAARQGSALVVFPEAFIPVYPSNRWARLLAAGGDGKPLYARLARESLEIPSPDFERLREIAREHGIWLATGANELDRGTIYNALLLFAPDGRLALHHRKLVPTNHERLVWGQGDGEGLAAVDTELGRVGGLICWENLMPLARFALYESGVEVYQRASSYPGDVPLADGPDLVGRGGSAIVGPDGRYLAGPAWEEEAILYADLDRERLLEERQRFAPAGHYHRPDVFRLRVRA